MRVALFATLTIAAMAASPARADVVNDWQFNETSGTTVTDSVGGRTGTIVAGSNTPSLGGGAVTIAGGGSDAGYVDLGSGLLSSHSAVTLEIWATPTSNQPWGRVFDVGSDTGNYLFLSWNIGGGANTSRLEWHGPNGGSTSDTTGFALNTPTYFAITVDSTGGSSDVNVYVNGTLLSSISSGNLLSDLNDTHFYLSKSLYGADSVEGAVYDDVRINDSVLSLQQIQQDYQQGPTPAVPAPASVLLLLPGLAALAGVQRARRTA